VVSRAQLLGLGLERGAIGSRLRRRWLHPVHRGVYAVGHTRLSARGRWLAAVLACGEAAALSHADAGALWDLRASNAARVHVTVAGDGGRPGRAGIVLHRSRSLVRDEVIVHERIRDTAVGRTLLDLAATLAPGRLERVVEQAVFLQRFDLHEMNATIARNRTRKGVHALETIIAALHDEPQLTRSELEGFFVDLCDASALPRPQINQVVEGFEVDFLWPQHRLIVETDGRRSHATRAAFERDRARDAALTVAGYRVVRFTYRQVVEEPARVARTLIELLAGSVSGSTASASA
jgi:Protein of unknown function (DUF559)